MPELPEAERNRTLCQSNLIGLKLLNIIMPDKEGHPTSTAWGKVFTTPNLKNWKTLIGRTFVSCQRRAKVIYWEFDQGKSFLADIMMHGAVGTALGGVCTIVGEPQNLLIADKAGWEFMEFFYRMDLGIQNLWIMSEKI